MPGSIPNCLAMTHTAGLPARLLSPVPPCGSGLDAVIGLFPAIGDIITTTLSLFIVHEAYQLGAPSHVIARMLGSEGDVRNSRGVRF